MKTFLTFLALLSVLLTFMVWTGDMNRYLEIQDSLKVLAEDCACGAALFTEEDSYSAGILEIDETAAFAYVRFLTEKAESVPPLAGTDIEAEVVIFDDRKGYGGAAEYRISSGKPAAAVTLTCTSPTDLFRLPFLTVYSVSRRSVYQWQP